MGDFDASVRSWIGESLRSGRDIDLCGIVFPTTFRTPAENLPSLCLSQAFFGGELDFRGVSIRHHICINDAIFCRRVRFDHMVCDSANFRECVFYRTAYFPAIQIKDTTFYGAKFFRTARFHGAKFEDSEFAGCDFRGPAVFSGCIFEQNTDLSKCIFGRGVSFHNSSFYKSADFRRTVFSGRANFESANFMGCPTFDSSEFEGPCEFDRATFRDLARFEGTRFENYAHFRAPRAEDPWAFNWISFSRAHFKDHVSFENRVFHNQTKFDRCLFDRAPQFHGCILHQDTDFAGACFPDTVSDEAVRAYRTLKLAMENARSRQEEAEFYAREQKSLRSRRDIPLSVKAFSLLYEVVSNYGQSYVRPALWIIAANLVFFPLIYLGMLAGQRVRWADVDVIARVTLQQVFKPFELFSLRALPTSELVEASLNGLTMSPSQVPLLGLAIVGAIQSLMTLALLALFLLAVRRRFKMD